MNRRDFMKTTGGLVLATGGAWAAGHARAADSLLGPPELPQGMLASSLLEALPGKVPLIKKSWRPPNFETPVSYFNEVFTPNDAFFVRYHLSNIPEVAAATWRLKVGGDEVGTPFEISLDQLKRDYEQVEIAAVCQCSGNRRGMFQPHVPGVEWGLGAMGNARWKGVRLSTSRTPSRPRPIAPPAHAARKSRGDCPSIGRRRRSRPARNCSSAHRD